MRQCHKPTRTTTSSSRYLAVVTALTALGACTASPPSGTVAGTLLEVGGQITSSSPHNDTLISGAVRAESVDDGKTYDVTVKLGSFQLQLPPGNYTVTGQMGSYPEFQCFVNNGMQPITVKASETTTADVICPIG
jgi:hypothetical protein